MKGVIFTNFLELIDQVFSPELTEELIERAEIPSGGAYTSVGAYDHGEILALVTVLSEMTGTDVPDLVRAFGKHLFAALGQAHPEYVRNVADSFELLEQVHDHIHVEVRKLYPEAELPTIQCSREGPDRLTVVYQSERPFADLAEGLIMGSIDHFADGITLSTVDRDADGCRAVFQLSRAS